MIKLKSISLKLMPFFLIVYLLMIPGLASAKIENPSEGETVGGIVPITISYSGGVLSSDPDLNNPIDSILLVIGGWYGTMYLPVSNPIAGSVIYEWDTTGVSNGLTFITEGPNGGTYPPSDSDYIEVYVNNPAPVISIISPVAGQTIPLEQTILPVTVSYHNVEPNYHGIKTIWLMITESNGYWSYVYHELPDVPTSGTYTWNINIAGYPSGSYTLQAFCTDGYESARVDVEPYGEPSYSNEVGITVYKPAGANNRGQPHDRNASQGEPVNIINGNMYIIKTDISTSAPGIPFEFTRAYNSMDETEGPLGAGWTHNFNITLTPPEDDTTPAIINDADGSMLVFSQVSGGVFKPPLGEYSTLTKTDSGYLWKNKGMIWYAFNSNGKLQSMYDRNNNTISLSYDSEGSLETITDTAGRNYELAYDTYNHITSITDTEGRTVACEYDSNGNLVKVTDPAGVVTEYEYNDTNDIHNITKQAEQANDNQFVYTYSYDDQDRCTQATGPNNKLGYSFEYKPDESKTVITDSKGYIITKYYNSDSVITKIGYPDGTEENFTWDGNLDKTSETFQDGSTWQYEYVNGNITRTTTPLLHQKVMGYDENDNLASLRDELGRVTNYTYDGNGNLTEIAYPDGTNNTFTYNTRGQSLTITDAVGKTTTFSYDGYGNLTSTTDPAGNTVTYTYDYLGRSSSITDAKGKVTQYQYDGLNRVTQITDALNGKINNTHTIAGLGSLTDQNNNKTSFQYDTLNQLTGVTDPQAKTKQFIYDDMGNLTSRSDFNGSNTTYAYNNMNRLSAITYPDNSGVAFAYDSIGRLTQSENYTGTSTYAYDAMGRITSYTDGQGLSVGYGYDAVGNLISLTYPGSQTVSYTYDDHNRLSQVTDWAGRYTTYSYDQRGLLTQVTLPNGTQAQYDYDNAGRMTGLRNLKEDSTIIASYTYTLDANGNIASETGSQPLDPLIGSQTVSYAYGSDNRLLSKDSASFTYDQNGNLTAKGDTTYEYDLDNRLKKVMTADGTWEYDYDGQGNRVGLRKNGNIRRFLLDPRGTTQVLAEYDGDGNMIANYIYGLGLVYKIDAAGNSYYYHYDFTGNTVALTDADGNVVNKYAYTPFGTLVGSEELVSNPFRYVGQYGVMDDHNGLFYMRARYYDPEVGRFITKDPIGFAGGANLYVYADDNPVNQADPAGLFSISASLLNDVADLYDEVSSSIEKMSQFEKDWLSSYGVRGGLDYELEWEKNERLKAERIHLEYYEKIGFIVVPNLWIDPSYRQLKMFDTNGDGVVAGDELKGYINYIKKDFETSISKICKK